MVGYRLGAKEATLQSRFGSNSYGRINLDEVDCKGDETDILECKFNPWGDHDCSEKEFAGVVCIDENRECGEVRKSSKLQFPGKIYIVILANIRKKFSKKFYVWNR